MKKRFFSIFLIVLMLVSIVPTEVFAASVTVGHANASEKGSPNGKKGDSTGREVTTKLWFDGGWTVCLRPKTAELAEKSVTACKEGCANNNIGYGQADRNSAYESYKKVGKVSKIVLSNTDGAAFMTLCAIVGGCNGLKYSGNAPTNIDMRDKFVATGNYEVLTDSKYLTSDKYLKSGDILVNETGSDSATVMVLTDGEESGTVLQGEETEKHEEKVKLHKNFVKTTVKIVREVKKTVFRIVESIVNIFSWKFGF